MRIKIRGTHRRGRRQRRGATAVEFAVVLPIILTVFLGALETTNLNFLRNMSNDVAFQVAREAIVPGANVSSLETEAVSFLATIGINGASLSTSVTPENRLRVEVTIPVDQNSWGMLPMVVGTSVVETCELSLQMNSS